MPELVRTQTRFPEEVYAKARVLAAIYDVSFNQFFVDVLKEKIAAWEAGHGDLPMLPEEEK